MTRDQLAQALRREALNVTVAQHRYEGARNRFNAASMEGSGKEAEEARQELHALLDVMLDSAACSMMLSRQMMESKE